MQSQVNHTPNHPHFSETIDNDKSTSAPCCFTIYSVNNHTMCSKCFTVKIDDVYDMSDGN